MRIEHKPDAVVLILTAADLSAPQEATDLVEDLVRRGGERRLVADLSGVPNLASLQAGALVALHLTCYENLAVLKLAGACEKVKRVLRLIGLDQIMEMHHGVEVALESFGPRTAPPPPTAHSSGKRKAITTPKPG